LPGLRAVFPATLPRNFALPESQRAFRQTIFQQHLDGINRSRLGRRDSDLN